MRSMNIPTKFESKLPCGFKDETVFNVYRRHTTTLITTNATLCQYLWISTPLGQVGWQNDMYEVVNDDAEYVWTDHEP
jgi:hypothetical protein